MRFSKNTRYFSFQGVPNLIPIPNACLQPRSRRTRQGGIPHVTFFCGPVFTMSDLEVLHYTFEKQSIAAFQQCAAELPTQSGSNVMDKKRTMRFLCGFVGITCGILHYSSSRRVTHIARPYRHTHVGGAREFTRERSLMHAHM